MRVPDEAARGLRRAEKRLPGVIALVDGEHVRDERRQLHERPSNVARTDLGRVLLDRAVQPRGSEPLLQVEELSVGKRQIFEVPEIAGLIATGRVRRDAGTAGGSSGGPTHRATPAG